MNALFYLFVLLFVSLPITFCYIVATAGVNGLVPWAIGAVAIVATVKHLGKLPANA